MTRMVTGHDLISRTKLSYEPERVWWSERRNITNMPLTNIQASNLIPDGSVIHEVQILARPEDELHDFHATMVLGIVSNLSPTAAEIEASEPVIVWDVGAGRTVWRATTPIVQECYPMRRILHGSHMRFAFSAITFGAVVGYIRVSILYSPR